MNTDSAPTLLASLGTRLMRFTLRADGVLQLRDELELPSPLHYAWPHPTRRVLLAGCSARWFTSHDAAHLLTAIDVPADGPMCLRGRPVPLRSRPIHVTIDSAARHVLALFNDPPGIQVHALHADASVGDEIAQRADLDVGIYPHQVRLFPGDRWVLVAARGNNAREHRPEDPGALRRYAFDGGRLEPVQVVAPRGGFGFGPRHVDFHPTLPCLYVSVERQNELHVYRHRDGVIDEQPAQVMSTLAPGKRPAFPQYAGAVHVHPQGRFVFVANRDDPHAGAEDSHLTGDNTMAVFAIDAQSGTVAPPRHYELDAYHVRTFSLQPPWLVAASQGDVTLEGQGAATRWVPASLGVFRISPDGALSALHRTPVPAGTSMLFWCAFPAAYRSRWD